MTWEVDHRFILFASMFCAKWLDDTQYSYGLACAGSKMAQCYRMFARPYVWCDWKADWLSDFKTDSQSWSQKVWSCATCANACIVHPAIRADCVIALTNAIQAARLIEEIVTDPIWADFSHWKSPERWLFHWRKSWKPMDIAMSCDTFEANVNKVCCQMFRS